MSAYPPADKNRSLLSTTHRSKTENERKNQNKLHHDKPNLGVVAVADVLVEAVKLFHVSVVQVVRGEVGTPSKPPFPGHLGKEMENTRAREMTQYQRLRLL